jgi:hypothetical protein
MRTIVILLFLTMNFMAAKSQSIYFGTGKTIAKLNFKDTEGNSLKGLQGSNEGTFYLGGRYPLFNTAFNISGDVSYQHYISKGSDPSVGTYFECDGTFVGTNLGFDYEFLKPNFAFYKKQAFSFCLKTSLGAEFLIDGMQNANNQIRDLKNAPEFKEPFYFVRGGVSGIYYFSKEIYAFIQYMGGRSILIGDYKNKQQVYFTTHSITIGLAYNFVYARPNNK